MVTTTWTGSAGTNDWFDGSNGDNGGPGAGDTAIIDGDVAVEISSAATALDLQVETSAERTTSAGDILTLGAVAFFDDAVFSRLFATWPDRAADSFQGLLGKSSNDGVASVASAGPVFVGSPEGQEGRTLRIEIRPNALDGTTDPTTLAILDDAPSPANDVSGPFDVEGDDDLDAPALVTASDHVSNRTAGDLTDPVRFGEQRGCGVDNGPDGAFAKWMSNGDALDVATTAGALGTVSFDVNTRRPWQKATVALDVDGDVMTNERGGRRSFEDDDLLQISGLLDGDEVLIDFANETIATPGSIDDSDGQVAAFFAAFANSGSDDGGIV